jgi:hypothetical protein
MSSTHDVVELATSDVRVPVHLLTPQQRMRLFAFYHSSISRHYHVHRGGSNFAEWFERSIGRRESERMGLERENIDLKRSMWPGESEYNVKMRIVPMYMRKFFQPGLSLPVSYRWKDKAEVVCARLCLTQTGTLYLEWYEGIQTDGHVEVKKASYSPVSIGNEKLDLIISRDPQLVSLFGHQVLYLLNADATEREKRAERDRDLFNELNSRGKVFGISYDP